MNASSKAAQDVSALMDTMGRAARKSASALRLSTAQMRNGAISHAANLIDGRSDEILTANQKDMANGRDKGLTDAKLDRLLLTPDRLSAIAQSLRAISTMPDVVGEVITTLTPKSGLVIERVRIPIGTIGIIFESRPNVTADAGALCIKSGNAAILRGGSESFHSSIALHACLTEGLREAGLPGDTVQYVETTDRAAVGAMLSGLKGSIDVIIPRGGKSLVSRVETEARVPVLSHLDGICHVYIDKEADPAMAMEIAMNAKMRRTGVCGAAETLLIHKDFPADQTKSILAALDEAGCHIRGDTAICSLHDRAVPATKDDWDTEYLDAILSVAQIDSLDQALAHIDAHSSGHTEAIVTNDAKTAERFLNEVDSAIVMHNASTQYADGGEFGLGAEIGIATGRLHARGPVGAEGLTTYKYRVRGEGQARP